MLKFGTQLLKISLAALSVFFLWCSAVFLSSLVHQPQSVSIGMALIQSVLLDFYLLGIFAFCFAWPVHQLLPDSYYEAVRSKSFASICAFLGMRQFGKLLRFAIWRRWLSRWLFFDGTRKGLPRFDRSSRRAEFIHTMAFVTIVGVCIRMGMSGDYMLASGALLVNVIWNFYPAVFQRYQRSRLGKLEMRSLT